MAEGFRSPVQGHNFLERRPHPPGRASASFHAAKGLKASPQSSSLRLRVRFVPRGLGAEDLDSLSGAFVSRCLRDWPPLRFRMFAWVTGTGITIFVAQESAERIIEGDSCFLLMTCIIG